MTDAKPIERCWNCHAPADNNGELPEGWTLHHDFGLGSHRIMVFCPECARQLGGFMQGE